MPRELTPLDPAATEARVRAKDATDAHQRRCGCGQFDSGRFALEHLSVTFFPPYREASDAASGMESPPVDNSRIEAGRQGRWVLTTVIVACAVGASHILRLVGLADYQGIWIGAVLLVCGIRGLRRATGRAFAASRGLQPLRAPSASTPTKTSRTDGHCTDDLLTWLCGTPAAARRMAYRAFVEGGIGFAVTLPWLLPAELYWRVVHGAGGTRWNAIAFDLNTVASEAIATVLPEEVFFRGWLLGALLLSACRSGVTSLSEVAEVPPGRAQRLAVLRSILAQSAIFAVFHVLTLPHPARLAVFFPGLLFGGLTVWRKGIGAACASHLLCNLYVRQLSF